MAYSYSHFATPNVSNNATDRVIELKPKTTNRNTKLFSDNKLHAVQDAGMWYLKFENGELPERLKQKFTGFNTLMKYLTTYFETRGIEIKEVKQ